MNNKFHFEILNQLEQKNHAKVCGRLLPSAFVGFSKKDILAMQELSYAQVFTKFLDLYYYLYGIELDCNLNIASLEIDMIDDNLSLVRLDNGLHHTMKDYEYTFKKSTIQYSEKDLKYRLNFQKNENLVEIDVDKSSGVLSFVPLIFSVCLDLYYSDLANPNQAIDFFIDSNHTDFCHAGRLAKLMGLNVNIIDCCNFQPMKENMIADLTYEFFDTYGAVLDEVGINCVREWNESTNDNVAVLFSYYSPYYTADKVCTRLTDKQVPQKSAIYKLHLETALPIDDNLIDDYVYKNKFFVKE